VSYVINNGPRPVAEATRQRVLQAIKKTGYRPNGIARALASGSTQTYGLVAPDISNPFIASMAHALQREAFADGKVLLLGDAGDNSGRERELINNMLNRQVDGLIYTSVDRHPYIELIAESGTPCVMLDRVDAGLNVSVIQVDEQLAAWQVTKHLIDHGYRDIGIICGPREMLNTQDRIRGWQLALEEASLAVTLAGFFRPITRGQEAMRRQNVCCRVSRRARCLPPMNSRRWAAYAHWQSTGCVCPRMWRWSALTLHKNRLTTSLP
jgi:LacI family transcriptional regulator